MQHSYVLHWWRIVCHVNIFSEILYKSLLFFNVHKVCANVLKHLGYFEQFSSQHPFNTYHFWGCLQSKLQVQVTELLFILQTHCTWFPAVHVGIFNIKIIQKVWQSFHASLSRLIYIDHFSGANQKPIEVEKKSCVVMWKWFSLVCRSVCLLGIFGW